MSHSLDREFFTLIQTLQAEDSKVRQDAVDKLRALGDLRGVKPLMDMLQDSNPKVRISAAIALGRLGDSQAIEPIIALFDDIDHEVRMWAASCFHGKLAGAALQPLLDILQDTYSGARTRGLAAWAVHEIASPLVVPALLTALQDVESEVRLQYRVWDLWGMSVPLIH